MCVILIEKEVLKEVIKELFIEFQTDKKPPEKTYYDSSEAAEILNVKVKTFYNIASTKKLKKYFFDTSSKPRYLLQDINSLNKENKPTLV